ncbi:MAG: M23 family metallopeptidase [Bacteroidales bacterium]|nr:M23 family metallopeptidase [Bacteroidales bacterium]
MKLFKKKYKFNRESLQYEEVKFSFKKFLVKMIPYTISSLVFGALIMFLYIVVFESPEEKVLRAENEYLEKNLEEMNRRLEQSDSLLDEMAKRDNYIYRTLFEQDTIPCTIRNAGIGGSDRYAKYDGFETSDLVKGIAKKLDRLESKMNVQNISYNTIIDEIRHRETVSSSLPIFQPIRPGDLTSIGSYFGYRMHPVLHILRMHTGIDMNAAPGTPVYASGDGVVITADDHNSGYGNMIEIDHKVDGLSSRYAHLSKILVKRGQFVKRGELIGKVGSTGMSTGPHLHYEVLIDGKQVNPLRYMVASTADEYRAMIEAANYTGVSFD